jgi:hypothetical protein
MGYTVSPSLVKNRKPLATAVIDYDAIKVAYCDKKKKDSYSVLLNSLEHNQSSPVT